MGEPIVFVPGLLCTEIMWRPQVTEFAGDHNITIGETKLDNSISGMASRILADAPDEFALAGLSMGGYVAFEMMRQAPDRVTRLALLDTRATCDTAVETERRKDMLALAGKGRFHGVTDRLMPLLVHPDRLSETDLTGGIKQMARDVGPDGFVRQTEAIMDRRDSRDTCLEIAVPSLVLCGRQDKVTPLHQHEEMASLLPDVEMVIIEDCGHMSTMERPAETNSALMDWLSR